MLRMQSKGESPGGGNSLGCRSTRRAASVPPCWSAVLLSRRCGCSWYFSPSAAWRRGGSWSRKRWTFRSKLSLSACGEG